MAEELLGPVFEIHGGGVDLVFPHHENEIAQSRALGHEFAEAWMHNGMLQFIGEKMSKSLGNVRTIRQALDDWGREDDPALLHERAAGRSRSTIRRRRCETPRRAPSGSATSSAGRREPAGEG